MRNTDDKTVIDRTEIPTVETVARTAENEDLPRPEHAASTPSWQRVILGIGGTRNDKPVALNPHECVQAADAIADDGNDRLDQQRAC